jgi:hypothetical protein
MAAASRFRVRLLQLLAPLCFAVLPASSSAAEAAKPPGKIDYNRDIRPILSDNCYACHGPDEKQRKRKLRLDVRESAIGELPDSLHAVVPGKSADSELLNRVTEDNPDRRMPPPKSGKTLTPQQIELLRSWIDQGAPYAAHWAFIAPVKPEPPKVADVGWPRNPIDDFILARLEREGLHPSPEAAKTTLIRRVTLDLTGLPPTPAEVDAFLADKADDAYERVVDRLLASPRYGEHMARFWLDAARFGDTHGLHLDNYREIWPYRDWVINTFNQNKPYDKFVVEQLAGDLLPNATLDQQIATGYIRCHVTTSEGGSIEDEVYTRNVVERVDGFGTVFLGMTAGCARCHNHKFDPLKQKEYYQFFAFFNNLDGPALDGNASLPPPVVKAPTPEQTAALDKLKQKIADIQKTIDDKAAQVPYDERADAKPAEPPPAADYVWIDDDLPPGAKPEAEGGVNHAWNWVDGAGHPVLSGKKSLLHKGPGLAQFVFTAASPGLRCGEGDKLFAYVYLDPADPPNEIMLQWNSGDWKHRAFWGENKIEFGKDKSTERVHMGPLPRTGEWVRLEVDAAKVGVTPDLVLNGWAFTQFGGTVYFDKAGVFTRTPQGLGQYFDTLAAWLQMEKALGGAGLPQETQDLVKIDAAQRNDAQKKQLRDYFIAHAYSKTRDQFAPLLGQVAGVEKEMAELDKQVASTLVFKERADIKPAYILKRGEYDKKLDEVGRDTPAFLPPLPPDAPKNRLGMAQWLVAPTHPLTARVEVNRLWQQVFGVGLVKTTEDFGTQGEAPSHPELLDWLAVQFREDGWDVKKMMKRFVMSAAYRQSSHSTKEQLAKDAGNRLLSHGPRFRLDAEELRDQALAASGLLVEKIGGPSVKPPQPAGLWEAVGYSGSNTVHFVADAGAQKVHRRSMYTFWKRTAPPPEMSILDAPSREFCTVRRERTDTPLQALMMLNDPQYVECARAMAERAMREGGSTPEERVAYLFRLATARMPDAKEAAELLANYKDQLAEYTRDVDAAKKLIAVGETKPDAKVNPSELAAWTMVANLILNLDEVISKG